MSVEILKKRPVRLFEGLGVEMEYMIVDSSSLRVLPVADLLLQDAAGKITNEWPRNGMAWSNELVLHVVEIKTNGPAVHLAELGHAFHAEAAAINDLLEPRNARLMPSAMHPLMDPFNEVKLWPHEYNPIYEAYHRIFNCRGHGWANVQSTHLNLPFYGDDEFEKLHAAVRVLLPLIPALAASSPIADGNIKAFLNYRMEMYRINSLRIPSITGKIVPEPVFSEAAYREQILEPMYRDIALYDPDGILQDEWLNSRGAMSRWDRNTIEIRVMDIQETPFADIAILEWVVALARRLTQQKQCSLTDQKRWTEHDLYDLMMNIIQNGEQAVINNSDYLSLFGIPHQKTTAGELCRHLYEEWMDPAAISNRSKELLQLIFDEGPLARRILKALPKNHTPNQLEVLYRKLCDCLHDGKPLVP